jgi:hypothetical protein
MPDFVVEIIIEQYVAFREGRLDSAEPRTLDAHDARRVRDTLVPAIRSKR